MYALLYATGAVLRNDEHEIVATACSQFMPIVCGGISSEGVSNLNCYSVFCCGLNMPTSVGVMRGAREGAASIAVLNRTTLWITGGLHDSVMGTDTTEWMAVSMVTSTTETNNKEKTLSEGIPLPMPMAFHCLEMVNEKIAILYGGVEAYVMGEFGLSSAWTIDTSEGMIFSNPAPAGDQWWIPRASMKSKRAHHSCGVIKSHKTTNHTRKFVVAAGGYEAYNSGLVPKRDVELLQIDEYIDGNMTIHDSWRVGCPLPITLSRAASATTGDQSALFIAGGTSVSIAGGTSVSIFSFRCLSTGSCWWTTEQTALHFQRIDTVALIIPSLKPENSGNLPKIIK